VKRARTVVAVALVGASVLAASQQWWGTPRATASPPTASLSASATTPAVAGEIPVTTVSGADAHWHNRDVVLTFLARVASGAVTAIQVKVDGGDVIETPGPERRLTIAAPGDHSGDGAHLVEFRALGSDGTAEAWQSVTLRIDTRRPSAALPHAVGAMQTSTAKIDYRVDDAAPGSGLAHVTIEISTRRGDVVKRLDLADQPTGVDLTARFRCDLPRAFYRVRVKARDLAGNAADAVPQTRLVVTRWMRLHGFGAQMVEPSRLAYWTASPTPLVDAGPHDKDGVRMYLSGGRLRDYPGGQARYGLDNLNAYRITGDAFYLERAAAQAQRLLDTHVSVYGAWYYPQRYSRYRHSSSDNGELMRNPWYSGMAQGQVLSFMVSMFEVTGQTRYRDAARATLNSFLVSGPASRPWVVSIDDAQRLWIQEWPRSPLDYTFNGHMIAAFGLYDYYRLTKDTLALVLFRAAASAALDYAPKFRRPGRASVYCLLHHKANEKYHTVHVRCLSCLAGYTGEVAFSTWSDLFRQDYPGPNGLRVQQSGDLLGLLSNALGESP
jgi:hypothetical protein